MDDGRRFGYRCGCGSPGSSCRIRPNYHLSRWGNHRGSAYALKLKWDGQETAEAISALHGICVPVFCSGFRCLLTTLPSAAPALSCCAFSLLLLAAHPYSVSPGCFLERRKSEHAGDFFWSSCSLAQRRGKCSTCSAINTLVLWKAW